MTRAAETCEKDPGDYPLISTWADDLNSTTNNPVTAARIIEAQLKLSELLKLPLSDDKMQLAVFYPPHYKKYKYRVG